MTSHILTEEDNGVLIVTLNRPDRKNALTLSMYQDLAEALARLDEMASLRAMVITGAGDCFTSGNDIGDFMANPPKDENSPVIRFLHALHATKKPLIAAVNGAGIGVGLTMLLHCDFVYMVAGSELQAPFTKLGLVPEAASSLLLPRLTGHVRAAEILLLGKKLSAEDAKDIGLVNEVTTADALMDRAMEAARTIAALPPEAIRLTKELLKDNTGAVIDRMREEGALFGERLKSPEAMEAFTAFMQKRTPDFSKFS